MATTDLNVIKDSGTTENREQAAKLAHTSKPDERVRAALYSATPGLRLDVDAVLARSLPDCHVNTLQSFQKRIFPWRRRNRLTTLRAIGNPEEVVVPDSPKVA
jgi:hypothetical protein